VTTKIAFFTTSFTHFTTFTQIFHRFVHIFSSSTDFSEYRLQVSWKRFEEILGATDPSKVHGEVIMIYYGLFHQLLYFGKMTV
jgi:hypothetical protein